MPFQGVASNSDESDEIVQHQQEAGSMDHAYLPSLDAPGEFFVAT